MLVSIRRLCLGYEVVVYGDSVEWHYVGDLIDCFQILFNIFGGKSED